jgi:hypothetical protein
LRLTVGTAIAVDLVAIGRQDQKGIITHAIGHGPHKIIVRKIHVGQ